MTAGSSRTRLEVIRGVARLALWPMALMSADCDRAHVRHALRCGVRGYLIKPFRADQRSERLRRIVAQLDGTVATGEAADASAAS